MAFLRWRGRCAQLLTTICRSKQITLINLPDFFISEADKQHVANKFPSIKVDWVAITRSLAEGPPKVLTTKTPEEHIVMAEVEYYLRKWAETAPLLKDASHLKAAASILVEWRAKFYQDNEVEPKPNMGQFQNRS
jgi:hypothetical protein